jgi:hypothetical protein
VERGLTTIFEWRSVSHFNLEMFTQTAIYSDGETVRASSPVENGGISDEDDEESASFSEDHF